MEESESAALPQGVEGEEEGDIDFLEVLRSSWELASAIQFCRLFGGCLKLKPFSTEKLEAALLEPDDHSMFLAELLYKLLRRDTREPYTEREAFVWEDLLKRKLDAQWPQAFTAHPMPGGDFYTIDPLSRMNILYALCEWRLDECAAIREVIRQAADNPETADHLRHEPIGEDSKGNRYFHFADDSEDCRLYREEPPRKRLGKKNKDRSDEALWETVCTTLEDMSDFAARMSASRNKNDKALHDLLTTSLLPKLMDTVQARRKAEERAAALEAMPKKRSSRLQVLQIKKDEEERKRKEEEEERARVQREQERVRKDREREMRLKARQDEEERLQRQAAELRRKLAGIHPDGPSREERYYRRLQQIDNGEVPSRGSSESRDMSASEPSKSQPQQQSQQQPQQQSQQQPQQQQDAPSEAVTEHNSPERKPTPPMPTPRFHQPLDFPMPPMGAMEAEPLSFHPQRQQPQSSAPWQQHHNPYRQQRDDFQQQQQQQQQYQQQAFADTGGRQLRQRGGNSGQEVRGRKREHSPGWSPMGLHVIKRRRALKTRPHRNMSALAKFGKPLPPPRMDDYYEGSDLDLSSESEGPVYKPRARADRSRRRQKDSDSDPDYEGEKSERSGRSAKARAAAKRSTASNTVRPSGGMQHQGFQSQQMQAQRLQEQEMQRRQLMARYQNATPAEQQLIKQQLLAQRQQQYLQQQQLQMAGMAAAQPGMAAYDAQAKQAALRQQMQAQQRQEVMRLLSTLTPEQREQLSRLPPPAQNQFLAQLRQRHMEQQQVAAQEAARQHEVQQRMLATLNPQQMQQLQAMPKPQQQAALASLTQRFQAQEQARLMQRQQAMQQMQQGNGSMAQPMLHQQQQQPPQHGFVPQGFQPRSQEHMPGTSGGMYSPRAMSGAQQQPQRSQFIPTQPMIPTAPPTMERGFQPQSSAGNGVTPDWARHSSPHPALQKASAGFAPQMTSMAGMLEPLPVSFTRQSGSLGQPQPVSGPLTSMSQPSLRPSSEQPQQPRTSSPFVPLEMQGGSRHQSGQPEPGEEAVTGRAEPSGLSRYNAPITTGQDKGPDGVDRAGAATSQVTSGASQGSQGFQQVPSGLQHVPAPTPVQPASRPMSSGPSPLLIITSAAPSTTVGVAAPPARDIGFSPAAASDPEAKRAPQELFQEDEAAFPDSEEQEGRCPSPLPVSIDEFGEADDLQDIDLPWESERTSPLQQPQQPAGAAMGPGVSEQQKEAEPSVTQMPSNAGAGLVGQSSLEPREEAAPGSAQGEKSLDGEGLQGS